MRQIQAEEARQRARTHALHLVGRLNALNARSNSTTEPIVRPEDLAAAFEQICLQYLARWQEIIFLPPSR